MFSTATPKELNVIAIYRCGAAEWQAVGRLPIKAPVYVAIHTIPAPAECAGRQVG
jgi:hypothetical protein